MKDELEQNRRVWDKAAEQFIDASSLPVWGPFGVGADLDLLPEIGGKTFLEIACGSGRSIDYLIKKGAQKVYGVDISPAQIAESKRFNSEYIKSGKVELIKEPMEKRLYIEPVDVVFSIYGFGWTLDPETSLRNIYSYLKPGGLFVWSWDHAVFSDVQYNGSDLVFLYSYHDEKQIRLENWRDTGEEALITYRKSSTWFDLLKEVGFQIDNYYEPYPVNKVRGFEDLSKYYSVKKAQKVPCSFIFRCIKPEEAK